jgi:hypothetical protein
VGGRIQSCVIRVDRSGALGCCAVRAGADLVREASRCKRGGWPGISPGPTVADQAMSLGRATIVSMVQAANLWNDDDRADRWRRD